MTRKHSNLLVLNMVAALLLSAGGAGAARAGQAFEDQSGSDFMEEVTPARPATAPQAKKIPVVDLSTVGVPTDESGNIVPLIDRSGGPVRQNFSQTQVYNEPAWNFLPQPLYGYGGYPYGGCRPGYANGGYPYGGYRPGYPNGGYPYGGWHGPYGGYTGGYPGYPGYAPGFNTGVFSSSGISTSPNASGGLTSSQSGSYNSGPFGGLLGGRGSFNTTGVSSGDGSATTTSSGSYNTGFGLTPGLGVIAPRKTEWQSTSTVKQLDLDELNKDTGNGRSPLQRFRDAHAHDDD